MNAKPRKWLLEVSSIMLLLVMLVIIVLYPLRMNRDAAVFVQFALRLLAGEQMWADFYVVNFPMVFYISAIPASIATATGLPVPLVFQLFVWVLVATAAFTAWWLLHRYYFDGEHNIISGIMPAVIVGFSAYILAHPDYNTMDFGQREHIFMLLLLPGFITRWLHWQGKHVPVLLAVIIGFLAVVGSVVKPQFLLLIALPELYWLATHRQWRPLLRPEVFAFGITGLVYAAWVLLMPGSGYYLGYVFPTFFPTYNSCDWYCEPLPEMFQRQGIIAVTLLFPLEWIAFRGRIPQGSVYTLLPALSILRLAALLSTIQQQKTLHYRALPSYMIFWISVALLGAFLLGRRRSGRIPVRWQYATTFIILQVILLYNFLTVLGTISITSVPRAWQLPPDLDLYNTVLENSTPGDTIALLTLDPALAHWMTLNTERRLISRYSAEYPLSFGYVDTGLQPGDDIPVLEVASDYIAVLRDDITQQQPPVILIEREREDRYPNIAAILAAAGLP
ncbi:MAG: hypothetical protein AAF653_13495, partial [Chloroflexota bacterium]